jgi:CubicO group peptidase (beta-lactamase class C family)
VAVKVNEEQSRVARSNGDYGWGGYTETVFWIDPKHDLICINLTRCIPFSAYPIRKRLRDAVYSALDC